MLSLKLLRQTLTDPLVLLPHHRYPATTEDQQTPPNPGSEKSKTLVAVLVFTPTNEVVVDTYRLASIARDIGLNLNPTPSLSHIVFSSSDSITTSFTSSMCVNDSVPLPFPSLVSASVFHLEAFASLARRFFKLVRIGSDYIHSLDVEQGSNWERSGMSLISRRSGVKVETMDLFSWAMAGAGWTLFKTSLNSSTSICKGSAVYLYRKVEANRLRIDVESGDKKMRVREVRLPLLDFKNAPFRILQYIILMTDDVFYLSA